MPDRSRMSSRFKYYSKWPRRTLRLAALAASAVVLLTGCGDEKKAQGSADRAAPAPGISVVVAPVVQKTVPLLPN